MTLFDAAKSVNAYDFASTHLNIEFNRHRKALSPFRSDEKTPSFSVSREGYFTDFGGDFKGGLIDLVMALKKLDNTQAAKYICETAKVPYEETKKSQTPKKVSDMQSFFKECHDALRLNFRDYLPHLQKIFVNVEKIVRNDELFKTLGWDKYNHSLVIAVYDGDRVVNLKWREKKGFSGKWIGASAKDGATTFLFPFTTNFKNYLVIVEGEKDALNLAALGVNVLTLGGVGNSWEKFEIALVGVDSVYIWFDYDRAGFDAVLPRAKEFYKMGVKNVFWLDFERLCHKKQIFDKFDVSNYLTLYPLENEEEFLKLCASKSLLIGKKVPSPSAVARVALLEGIRSTTADEFFTLAKFEYALLSGIKRYSGAISAWAEAKKLNIEKLYKSVNLASDILKNNGNAEDAISLAKLLSSLSNLDREIKYFSVEKRIKAAEYLENECERLGYSLKSDGVSVYYYNGRYYEKWDIDDFHRLYLKHLGKLIVEVQDISATEAIYMNLVKIVPKLSTSKTSNIVINVKNCVVDMTLSKTFKHDRSYEFSYMLPFDYDKDAKCAMFDAFLDSSLPNKALQNLALEYLAYMLLEDHKLQKFLLLTGKGANGKSVFMDIMKAFFSSNSIGRVAKFEGFAMEGLVGKMVNFAEDRNLSNLTPVELDTIKMMSDGTAFEINPKFRSAILLERPPKLVISTNNMPKNTEPSFIRRLVLLPFEHTFTYDHPDPKYRRIDGLSEMIINSELSGIFNRVLEAMRRLMQSGRFSASDETKSIINEFELDANNVYRFASEHIRANKDVIYVPIQSVYDKYREFCEAEGVNAKSKNNFGKDLKEYMKVESRVMNLNNVSTRIYSGIELI